MINLITTALGVGLILSLLTGPVFFALLKTSVERGFIAGVFLALGVVISDIIYISLAFYSTQFLAFEMEYKTHISIVGGIFLLGIGTYYVFKKVKIDYEKTKIITNTGFFLKGFFMCILNPFILFYWISVASITIGDKYSGYELLLFFAVASLTIFSMDILKAYFASLLRSKIKENYLTWLNRVAGTVIIVFALQLMIRVLI